QGGPRQPTQNARVVSIGPRETGEVFGILFGGRSQRQNEQVRQVEALLPQQCQAARNRLPTPPLHAENVRQAFHRRRMLWFDRLPSLSATAYSPLLRAASA